MRHRPHPYRVVASLALALSLVAGPLQADDWWGADKAKHLGVGLGLGAASYGGLRLLDASDAPVVRLSLASFVASLPGLGKELYDDGQPGNAFSGKDLLWSTLGALVGSAIGLGVELLLKRLLAPARASPAGR